MANYNPAGFAHICRAKNSIRQHWCEGHFTPTALTIPFPCRCSFTTVRHPCNGHPTHSDLEVYTLAMGYQSQRQAFLEKEKIQKEEQRDYRHETQLVVPMEVPMPPPMPEDVANRNSAQGNVNFPRPVPIKTQRSAERRTSPKPVTTYASRLVTNSGRDNRPTYRRRTPSPPKPRREVRSPQKRRTEFRSKRYDLAKERQDKKFKSKEIAPKVRDVPKKVRAPHPPPKMPKALVARPAALDIRPPVAAPCALIPKKKKPSGKQRRTNAQRRDLAALEKAGVVSSTATTSSVAAVEDPVNFEQLVLVAEEDMDVDPIPLDNQKCKKD